MKEQNTNYAYKLKYLDNPTFDKVRDLDSCINRTIKKAEKVQIIWQFDFKPRKRF